MIIFAGPSLSGQALQAGAALGADFRRPVRRGDIRELTARQNARTLIIADGVFHQVLSVGHRELLEAIDAGWRVIGVSSMGAIRAYELRDSGMLGFGKVFARFFETDDFRDDELALLHEDEYPYRSYTEPLVHYRACVEWLVAEGRLASDAGRYVIDALAARYFGDRSLTLFRDLLSMHLEDAPAITADMSPFREKQADLVQLLRAIQSGEIDI